MMAPSEPNQDGPLGLEVGPKLGVATVTAVVEGGQAALAGVAVNDAIAAVDSEPMAFEEVWARDQK